MRRDGRATRTPLLLAVPALCGCVLLVLPLIALLARTPWTRLGELLGRVDVQQALWLSLRCAVAATVLSTLLGIPLAWVLSRTALPGLRLLRGLVTVPLVLPPVVVVPERCLPPKLTLGAKS